MSEVFKLRAIVAKEPTRSWPQIVCAVSEDTWEVMPPEEWDKQKREICEEWLGPDWTVYDFAEVVLEVPAESLRGLFSPAIPVSIFEETAL